MIHFVHYTVRPGGIEVLLPEIIDNMPEYPFQAFVIRPSLPGQANVYESKNISITYGGRGNRLAFWRLWRYARRYRKDIFHVFNIGPFNLLVLRLAGVRNLIYSIHGTIYWKNAPQKWLRKPAWRMGKIPGMAITANSQYSRSVFIQQIYSEAEVRLLYNPINMDRFRINGEVDRLGDEIHVIYVGRLTPGKNLPRWLSIAAKLALQNHRYRFTIYGDGPIRSELDALADTIGLGERVRFAGYVRDIADAYRSADVLLFLSEYESFGNVAVESILCGTPVLAAAIPSMREIFRDFPEFLLPTDFTMEEAVMRQMRRLPELKELTLAAAANFRERFSLHQFVKHLQSLYAF
jgi:glycosyltransferase involved in cell wall biosynthesis